MMARASSALPLWQIALGHFRKSVIEKKIEGSRERTVRWQIVREKKIEARNSRAAGFSIIYHCTSIAGKVQEYPLWLVCCVHICINLLHPRRILRLKRNTNKLYDFLRSNFAGMGQLWFFFDIGAVNGGNWARNWDCAGVEWMHTTTIEAKHMNLTTSMWHFHLCICRLLTNNYTYATIRSSMCGLRHLNSLPDGFLIGAPCWNIHANFHPFDFFCLCPWDKLQAAQRTAWMHRTGTLSVQCGRIKCDCSVRCEALTWYTLPKRFAAHSTESRMF